MSLPRVRAAPSTTSWATCAASRAVERSTSGTGAGYRPRCLRDRWRNGPAIAQTRCCHRVTASLTGMDAIAAIQRRQHGLITVAQAVAAGLTADQVRDLNRRGVWSMERESVYAPAGPPPTTDRATLAP